MLEPTMRAMRPNDEPEPQGPTQQFIRGVSLLAYDSLDKFAIWREANPQPALAAPALAAPALRATDNSPNVKMWFPTGGRRRRRERGAAARRLIARGLRYARTVREAYVLVSRFADVGSLRAIWM